MPWHLEKEFRFESSHQLKHHDGKCARLHGHSWVGKVRVVGDWLTGEGPKKGMVMDFGDLKSTLANIVDRLDHHHLNDVVDDEAPTSEVVAWWVYQQIKPSLPTAIRLVSVRIEETCTSAAEYSER